MHRKVRTDTRRGTFRSFEIAILPLALAAIPSAALAGPPAQLHGKSISVSWAEQLDQKFVTGEQKQVVINAALGVYVSTSGRIFSRSSRTSQSPRKVGRSTNYGLARSHDPTGSVIKTSNARYEPKIEFHGRTMTQTTVFESGARRVTVNFDESFRTCTVNVILGKEAGAPGYLNHALDTRLRLTVSATVASQSCRIADGNVFGAGGT